MYNLPRATLLPLNWRFGLPAVSRATTLSWLPTPHKSIHFPPSAGPAHTHVFSVCCYTKINPQPMPPHCSGLRAFCCRAAVSALIFCKWWLCGLALPASLLLQFICWPHDGEEQTQSQCRLGAAQAASPVIYASYIAGCSFQPYQHDG